MVLSDTPSRRQLVNLAILISVITILSNIVEGVLSMFLGSQSNSVSLVIFGIGSFVEMTSSSLVLWRFLSEFRKDPAEFNKEVFVGKERKATIGIGFLFLTLAAGTFLHAIISLSQKSHPENTIAGLVISIVSIVFMLFVYGVKRYLAVELDSSTMASEAQCSLACIKITGVLFCSSLFYMIWQRAWWIDSAAALLFSIFFAKEGYEMVKWATSNNFNGGYSQEKIDGDKGNISEQEVKLSKENNDKDNISIQAVNEKEEGYSIDKNNMKETKDNQLEPRISDLHSYQRVVC
ncbi:11761_t:CDS:1 [Acaulospora morrowiae]|uniref:11761_t:CDS:1 n=1 Tax=Acaulospora morrowiae TaxID=94023 RepID=A0A9N8W9X1_9GLOM|nr:11761_t:CDS:1 [Acaulospora morrowiae]